RAIEPRRKTLLVLDVTIHPRADARRAEFFQMHVELFSALTELRVVRVAQCTHGIANCRKSRSVPRISIRRVCDRAVQFLRAVWRLGLAVSANDHQCIFLSTELRQGGLRHVEHGGGELTTSRFLRRTFRQRFSGPRLRTENDGERCQRRWSSLRGST